MAIPVNLSISTTDEYQYAAAVTLDDAGVIPMTRALWISHANSGTIKVRMLNGDDVTFSWQGAVNLLLPIRVSRVWLNGTTALLNVIALY